MKAILTVFLAGVLAGCANSNAPQPPANEQFDARYAPPDKRGTMPEPSGISPAGPEYR